MAHIMVLLDSSSLTSTEILFIRKWCSGAHHLRRGGSDLEESQKPRELGLTAFFLWVLFFL